MKGKPNIDAFLSGGKADTAGAAAPVTKPERKPARAKPPATPGENLDEPRITKTIRIARSLDVKLKEEAHRRSMAGSKKVAESDLIEEALLQYFNKYLNT
jgi:hypothetical protein